MRKDQNPAKSQFELSQYRKHHIIIPVYIPHFEGFFQQIKPVLRMCLESLRLSIGENAHVSIISNGSHPSIVEMLDEFREQGWIEQLIINKINRGKIDAVVSVARGSFSPLITIADADVLFCPGWLQAVEQIFCHFPECGMVTPFPGPSGLWNNNHSTVFAGFFSRILRFEKVVGDEDLDMIIRGIGRDPNKKYRSRQLHIKRGETIGCIGGGHMVVSFRRELLQKMPSEPSLIAVANDSETQWFDIPPDRAGMWKLSTSKTFVHHMGNIPEPWMEQELAQYRHLTMKDTKNELPPLKRHWSCLIPWRWKIFIVRVIRKLGFFRGVEI